MTLSTTTCTFISYDSYNHGATVMHLHYIYLDLRRADVANSLSFEELSPQKKITPNTREYCRRPRKGWMGRRNKK